MFRIGICDDENFICSQIERIILDNRNLYSDQIEVEVFYSGERLAEFMKKEQAFDLLFLDIEMEGLNGLQLGMSIREELDNQTMQIVYVSGKEKYFKELFEVRPMHFLSKPIESEQLIKDVNLAMRLSDHLNQVFHYQKSANAYRIPIREIIYFQSLNREIKIVTRQGEDKFYGKLKEIYQKVKENHFIQIHKSYLVNYEHIKQFKYDKVIISNSSALPISQSKRKEVRRLQMLYEIERMR